MASSKATKTAPKKAVKKVALKSSKQADKPAKPISWPKGRTAFEQACKILGRKPVLPGTKGLPAKHANHIVSGFKLVTIIEAINSLIPEPVVFPNYNVTQAKYYNWWWVKATAKQPGGVGLSYTGGDCTVSTADCGSRFFYKTPEARTWLHRPEFKKLWIEYILIQEK